MGSVGITSHSVDIYCDYKLKLRKMLFLLLSLLSPAPSSGLAVLPDPSIDYDSILPCNTTAGYSGLMCGSTCVANHVWCNPAVLSLGHPPTPPPSCGTFTTHHPLLCRNTTFWSSKTCDFEERGEVLYYGRRCRGTQQHCYYTRHDRYDYSVDDDIWRRTCSDMSDKVIPTDCTTLAADYCHNFCPAGADTVDPDAHDDDDDCDDPDDDCSVFTDKNTGRTVQKGWECKSVCSSGSQDCQESCTTAGYNFTCRISGKEHCLHPHLVCDGHPLCDQGEDEQYLHNILQLRIVHNNTTRNTIDISFVTSIFFSLHYFLHHKFIF